MRPDRMFTQAWAQRELMRELVKREIADRYRGTVFGLAWSFSQPIFMLAVYTVAIGMLLGVKWPGVDSHGELALALYAGLLVFNLFADCMSRAGETVAAHPNYVKKVVFPLPLLAWTPVIAAAVHMLVNLAVWLAFYVWMKGMPHWTVVFVPAIMLPVMLMSLGLVWIVGAIGVYARDIGHASNLVVQAMLFLSPIFYDARMLPQNIQDLLRLNPLGFLVSSAREAMMEGRVPDLPMLAAFAAGTWLFAMLGLALFERLQDGFADAL